MHTFMMVFVRFLPISTVISLLISLSTSQNPSSQTFFQNHQNPDSNYDNFPIDSRIAKSLGQYSPWFDASAGNDEGIVFEPKGYNVPNGCKVTQAQILQRHGTRQPTPFASITTQASTILLQNAYRKSLKLGKKPDERLEFLKNWEWNIVGEGELLDWGRWESFTSGRTAFSRYQHLLSNSDSSSSDPDQDHYLPPFIRSADSARVIESAEYWAKGFSNASQGNFDPPEVSVIIPECQTCNNTLDATPCPGLDHSLSKGIKEEIDFRNERFPEILKWFEGLIWGNDDEAAEVGDESGNRGKDDGDEDEDNTTLSLSDIENLLSLCSFDTFSFLSTPLSPSPATTTSSSPFCHLFSPHHFKTYSHLLSLSKYHGYNLGTIGKEFSTLSGNGYLIEVVGRLESGGGGGEEGKGEKEWWSDKTNVWRPEGLKRKLNGKNDNEKGKEDEDGEGKMQQQIEQEEEKISMDNFFPLRDDERVFIDFSHDNSMLGIFGAIGLGGLGPKPTLTPVLKTTTTSDEKRDDEFFVASKMVPFGGRMAIERLECEGSSLSSSHLDPNVDMDEDGGERVREGKLVRILINEVVQDLAPICRPQQSQDQEENKNKKMELCDLTIFLQEMRRRHREGEERWGKCLMR